MIKYIFDFDDVLFYNTSKFKKHMYKCFEEIGVSCDAIKTYYQEERDKGFVLRNLVISVIDGEKISSVNVDELIEKIMVECKNFVNNELIDKIKILGAEHCYMVTHGVTEYQMEKINRTGIRSLFCNIVVVQDTKKWSIEDICENFINDEVVFVDDKEKRFVDLDFEKYPNLRIVHYVGRENIADIFKENSFVKV